MRYEDHGAFKILQSVHQHFPDDRPENDRLRSSDELSGGVAFAVFEGVYKGFQLFISHANALSDRAPAIHGMHNFAQYLPGSRAGDAEISNY